MTNLSVTACSFSVRRSYTKKDVVFDLNHSIECNDKYNNKVRIKLEDMFENFFDAYNNYVDNDVDERLFSCELVDKKEDELCKYLVGIVKSGVYGITSELIDKNTKTVDSIISPNQAPVKTFYFVIVIPKDVEELRVNKGIMFFHNIGAFGIKTVTLNYLRNFLSDEYKISLKTGNIAPSIFVDKVLGSRKINKIHLVKNKVSSDDANIFGFGSETRILSDISLGNMFKEKITRFINHRDGVFEFEDIEYDGIKIEADFDGRERTINLSNIENVSVIESISSDVAAADGIVNSERIFEEIKNISDVYLSKMALRTGE